MFDKLVTDNLMKWKRLEEAREIVVLTMLRGNSDGKYAMLVMYYLDSIY